MGIGNIAEAAAYLVFAASTLVLACIDYATGRLPNAIVGPSYCLFAVLLVGAVLAGADPHSLGRAAAGSGALFVSYFLLAVLWPGHLGFGDVKLAGFLGLALGWAGWASVIVGVIAAHFAGGMIGAVNIAGRKRRRRYGGYLGTGVLPAGKRIPFGPSLVLGAWTGIVAGGSVAAWYLGPAAP